MELRRARLTVKCQPCWSLTAILVTHYVCKAHTTVSVSVEHPTTGGIYMILRTITDVLAQTGVSCMPEALPKVSLLAVTKESGTPAQSRKAGRSKGAVG